MNVTSTDRLIIEPGGSYTVKEACAWLGWDRHTFYDRVRECQIPVILGGKSWRIVGSDLLDLRHKLAVGKARLRSVGGRHAY